MGKKKKPIYKIVAADSRAPRDGRFIEAVGQYNPNVHPIGIEVKETLIFKWLKSGAIPTDTVRNLLSRKGLWLKWHLMRKGVEEAVMQASLERWSLAQPGKAAREAERRARRKSKKKATAAEAQPAPVAAE